MTSDPGLDLEVVGLIFALGLVPSCYGKQILALDWGEAISIGDPVADTTYGGNDNLKRK